jgi:glycosyltransferase involved in cell wall biosynthesis
MKLSVIIPVFNEEKTIEKIIEEVFKAPALNYQKEIIVVNDCSTDGTQKILNRLQQKFNLILLKHGQNKGKGTAVRTGIDKASGNAIIIQDADLEYDPSDWPKILRELENPDTLVVYGSRNINPEKRGYFICLLGVKFLTFLINIFFNARLTDSYTCYKAFRSEVIKSLKLVSDGFEFEVEVTAKILKKGIKIKEVPIRYNPRRFKEGKKINFFDAIIGIWTILKNRF